MSAAFGIADGDADWRGFSLYSGAWDGFGGGDADAFATKGQKPLIAGGGRDRVYGLL